MNLETAAVDFQQQAEVYLTQGRLEDAIAICTQALQQNPNSAQAYKILGKVLQTQGKLEEAKQHYETAISLQPNFAEAFANLGTLYSSWQQWDRALDCYQQAIALQPNFAGAYRNLARVLSQSGKPEEATDYWYLALTLQGEIAAEPYFDLGNTLKEHNKLEKAVICYRRALYLNPSYYAAYCQLAEIEASQQKWDNALQHYRRAIEIQPDISDLYWKVGNVLQEKGCLEEAVTSYRTGIDLNPDSFWSYYYLGNALSKLQKWQDAVVAYQMGIAIDPNFSWCFYYLGLALTELQQWEEATIAYRRAIELDSTLTWSYHYLADALRRLQQLEAAVETYHRAIELNPAFAWSYYGLGESLRQQKQWKAAVPAYLQAIELEPQSSILYDRLGEALVQGITPDPEETVSSYYSHPPEIPNEGSNYHTLLNLPPRSSALYSQIAQKFTERNQLDLALIGYQMALEMQPGDSHLVAQIEEIVAKKKEQPPVLSSALSEFVQTLTEVGDRYLAQVVTGKTFATVGRFWGVVSPQLAIAHQCGATKITVIDLAVVGSLLQEVFQGRMAPHKVTRYYCISHDICQLPLTDMGVPYDVVYCANVLFRHPQPRQVLENLYQMVSEYLILTSAITQTTIENHRGIYQVKSGDAISIPDLTEEEREILKTYWQPYLEETVAYGISEKAVFEPNNLTAWWWLPTPECLESMCLSVGFEVLDKDWTWHNNAMVLLLKKAKS